MARFRIGQQIKKVRGDLNIGVTGTYTGVPDPITQMFTNLDLLWRPNSSWTCGRTKSRMPPGLEGCDSAVNFEPAIDPNIGMEAEDVEIVEEREFVTIR